jgi:hypothetical protein
MEVNVGGFKWIPVFCLSFSIFVASFGTMSVPFFAIPEILPEKVWFIYLFSIQVKTKILNFSNVIISEELRYITILN